MGTNVRYMQFNCTVVKITRKGVHLQVDGGGRIIEVTHAVAEKLMVL